MTQPRDASQNIPIEVGNTPQGTNNLLGSSPPTGLFNSFNLAPQ